MGTALLPKLTCPACWPAYAGLLSALGLGFIDYTPYLLPLTLSFLVMTIFSLGYRARKRRGYRPLITGVVATVVVLIGKFVFASDWVMYGGLALLLGASIWNSWPQRKLENGVSVPPVSQLTEEVVTMSAKRQIEIFSAGCAVCEETIEMVNRVACPSCEISILDVHEPEVARRAKNLGIRSVPAVVIEGQLADCCAGRGPDESTLRAAGVGQPV